MSRLLIIFGAVLLVTGLAWPWIGRLGLGRLPGDIVIKGAHGGLYFPVVTCLLISAIVSGIVWLSGRF